MDRVSYPVVKVSATAATTFVYTEYFQKPKRTNERSLSNLVKGTPSGELSVKNQKRIKELAITLHAVVNSKNLANKIKMNLNCKPLSFITLTLSEQQKHDDKHIKRHMLDRFLVVMKENGYLKNYIWKAETQKNGNIHFHIITDSYIPYLYIRNTWNNIQKKQGYLDNYHKKTGHFNAPSTEIRACKSVNQTAGYAAKYIAKGSGSRAISGRVWGCSDNVKHLKVQFFYLEQTYLEALEEGAMLGHLKKKEFEQGYVYTGKIREYLAIKCPRLLQQYINSITESWQITEKSANIVYTEEPNKEPNVYTNSKVIQLQLF